MKIFQIGFNRCGTRSIHGFLAANGMRGVHWENGRVARRMFVNLSEGRPLLAGLEQFDVFTDMEMLTRDVFLEAYKLFPILLAQHPDAVFILNTREREAWIRSRMGHAGGSYLERFKAYLGGASQAAVADAWRADWERHHKRVLGFFAKRPARFFVCPVDQQLPYLLAAQMPELKLDPRLYETLGAAGSEPSAAAGEVAPTDAGITSG